MHCKYTYNREVPTVLYKEAFCAGNFMPLSSLGSYWTADNLLFFFSEHMVLVFLYDCEELSGYNSLSHTLLQIRF